MVTNDTEPPPTHTPSYRRPALIGLALIVLVGAVLGIVLGVTLTDASSKSSTDAGSLEASTNLDDDVRVVPPSPPPSLPTQSMPTSPTLVNLPPSSVSPSFRPSSPPSTRTSKIPTAGPSPIVDSSAAPTSRISQTITHLPTSQPTLSPQQENGEIVLGTTSNNVEYYHCHTASGSPNFDPNNDKQIVLLHGSAFTKETWRSSSDMLDKFCAGARTVVALDLSVSTNHQGLIQVLEALQQASLVQLPISMLVTPSASGFTIVDWMRTGNVQDLPNYVSTWVPVATGSLTTATDEQVASLVGNLSILAIHGNDDMAGGRYSNRLGTLAQATVVELIGRHAVYLQSPDEFVQTILDY